MAERLNLNQAEAVAAYLSREIIHRNAVQKIVRVGNDAVIGSNDDYHEDLARQAGLALLNVPGRWGIPQDTGCNDGAKIVHQVQPNRMILFDLTSGLTMVTNQGEVVKQASSVDFTTWRNEYRRYEEQITACRLVTCQLLIAAVNMLANQPELYWTITDKPSEAMLYSE